jgi:mannitol/fructose-specific phosphotransferase system IIA component
MSMIQRARNRLERENCKIELLGHGVAHAHTVADAKERIIMML